MAQSDPLLITDTDISGVLKKMYSGFRTKVFPIVTPLMANIEKGTAGGPRNLRWGGEGVVFNAVLTRPVGMTASTAGYFPPSSVAVEKQGTIPIKRLYVNRRIDGLAIAGTATKEAAYVALGRKIIEEAKDAAKLGMQEVGHGNGLAIKAVLASSADTTHFVATSPYGIASAGKGGLLLDVGMYIAVLDTTGVTVRGRATITNVANSGDNATVTLDTAVAGMVATDIVVAATTSDTSYNSFPNGLVNITNRGGSYNSFLGIDASTYARWDAVRLAAGSNGIDANNPSEMDIWELATQVAGKSGKDAKLKPKEFLLLTTPGLEKKFAEQHLGQRRWMSENNPTIKGGFKAVQICGIPMVSDFWCPAGTVYLVHLPSLLWVDAKDWGQVQYESAGAWRWVSGRDAFETNWATYVNLATVQRNSHGSITGYTDTVRYDFVM
jgi:hypothetical protein